MRRNTASRSIYNGRKQTLCKRKAAASRTGPRIWLSETRRGINIRYSCMGKFCAFGSWQFYILYNIKYSEYLNCVDVYLFRSIAWAYYTPWSNEVFLYVRHPSTSLPRCSISMLFIPMLICINILTGLGCT
jgi:hypothetical protein